MAGTHCQGIAIMKILPKNFANVSLIGNFWRSAKSIILSLNSSDLNYTRNLYNHPIFTEPGK